MSIPILFMFFCAWMLIPFMGWAIWLLSEADRIERRAAQQQSAEDAEPAMADDRPAEVAEHATPRGASRHVRV